MYVELWIKRKIALKDGEPTQSFDSFLNVLTTQMQRNLSDDGIAIPGRTTAEINAIFSDTNPDTSKPQFLMLFDTETNELKIRDVNGNARVIQFL